jgi:hypothetical protein
VKKNLLIVLYVLLTLNIFGQTEENKPKAVGIEEVYLAKDNGNGEAGDAVEKFQTTDIPIYCVIQLDSVKPSTVKMSFIAVAVKGVKADTNVVSVSYKTNGNQDRVNFTGKPDKFWTAGSYRVDVYIDGKLAQSKTFEIEKSAINSPVISAFQPKQTPKPKPAVRKVRKN